MGVLFEERSGGKDLATLTVATLRDLFGDPGLLYRVGVVGGKSFDGGDGLVGDRGGGDGAGADGVAVKEDGAGAALGDAAAEFRAGEADDVPDDPEERHFFIGVDGGGFPVYLQRVFWHDDWFCLQEVTENMAGGIDTMSNWQDMAADGKLQGFAVAFWGVAESWLSAYWGRHGFNIPLINPCTLFAFL
jgi:hypothetical protein